MNEIHELFDDNENSALSESAQARSYYPKSSHIPTKPRAARHDPTSELLTKHYSANTTGHLENEMAAPQINAVREAAMRDAQENYEIMMEFHRELSSAFSKIIEDHKR